ncbi:MAG: ABC transporter ATP-binding protein/permease [Candidatus Thioglobus sp.]|jgi:ATP-binding cassette subfamily B protein|uniref:ABCB family ABC transporter ATP-binding protein/permease n=1 Tax=Candidatus Thioglobus sp. TaxID=2026721 RepID=UPI0001BD34D3|nr:ABC transporter ATP-binding protein/permease [Candidatus Thioglobus sp.]EEZ80652.1 MAG: ABC-type transporter [uncultured Candidatus Thioglobus sp.]MBT3186820.1 ABC transporter ATP-binding protein/permease [Candidatus Thioglobus sp.]MBT3431092.1 ABC transporter ATP-binding protein/permease [Candidatus Thioglobus sp.]MBT3965090.1 ABC transporter ATP-binding protein/permease [Candidatus Thioglobus sp.]MBT4316067.1 ABC transporter ATP-binding protein/permease [Candidatus Thioglobus sp.]
MQLGNQTQAYDFKTRDIKVLKKLMPYLLKMRVRVALATLFLIFAKLANVAVPVVLKEIVDSLDQTNVLLILPLGMLFAYGALRLASSLFNELRDAIFAKVRYHAMHLIALGVFKHLHTLDLSFHLNRRIGGITRDIDRGTQSVSTLLSIFVFNILPSFFEICLVIGILWVNYDVFFASISLVTVVLYIGLTLAITTWRMKYRYQMNDMQSEANTNAVDSLINYETVKYFNQEDFEVNRYDDTMSRWEDVATKSFTSMTALNFIQGAVIAVGVTIILVLASQGVVDQNLSLGDLIMIQALLLQLFMPLGSLGIIYRQIKHNFIDMNNMFDLLERTSKVQDIDHASNLKISKGKVEFNQVAFAYQGKDEVLKDISFVIEPGQKVAIVGSSGAGKSTLAKLLFRFYDVSKGEILIDGQNIKLLDQRSVQTAIGVVPQDTVMFNESIYYNIAYGKKNTTKEEVERAAKLSFIDGFIDQLPQGYDTLVGERGLKLSGGEKQRLAIARVLLKNPPILIFDEATSALDSHSEKMVQKALKGLASKHTTLVIAHRLSTIVDADKIIVLSDGLIKESGTHDELLKANGQYASLWKMQSKDSKEKQQ